MKTVYYHIDVNSAFLSWEALYLLETGQLDYDLREKCAIIGGDETKRHGIVLAKSTSAKRYGIQTAEPVIKARQKCPNLIVVPPHYENYVKRVMQRSGMYMGGTYYEPVLSDMVNYYKNIEPSEIPAFIIFITDGENMDKSNTNRIIKELSEYNIFVQFIGIGNESFNYLKSLDNLDGRKHDNTGFTAVKDMNKLDDQQLYTEILRQYKDWLNNK